MQGMAFLTATRARSAPLWAVLLGILAIDSELEDVPMGVVRERWAPEALAERDRAAEEYLTLERENIFRACQALIAKWGPAA